VHWLRPPPTPGSTRRQGPRDIDVAHIGSENRGCIPERVRLLDLIRSRYRNTFIAAQIRRE